jgi:hypothetical protein
VKRFIALAFLLILIAACTPKITIENNVIPTIFSVSPRADNTVLIQGRYLGDGTDGQAENSYVKVGADVNCSGGIAIRANRWTPSRIEITVPEGAGFGFVCVVVRGNQSNALSANLP